MQSVNDRFAPLRNTTTSALQEATCDATQMALPTCRVYTADTGIKTGAGIMHSVGILSGTLATAVVYDNTAASGTKLIDLPAFTAGATLAPYVLQSRSSFTTGLYLDVGGTSPKVQVCYQ